MTKRVLAAVIAALMALCLLPAAVFAQTGEPDGTGEPEAELSELSLEEQLERIQGQANPVAMFGLRGSNGEPNDVTPTFYISRASQLKDLASYVNGGVAPFKSANYMVVKDDIDLSVYASDNAGKGWTPIGNDLDYPFMGVFDGQNYTIKGLAINNAAEDDQGLFGYVDGKDADNKAQVKNVIVENASVNGAGNVGAVVGCYGTNTSPLTNCAMLGGSVTGAENVGGVAGKASGITDCYSTGAVSGEYIVGGVVGLADAGVTNCHATGSVTGAGSSVRAGGKVGGVVGSVYGNVSCCYATGNVTGSSNVGGVVGWSNDDVSSCYATGKVSGVASVGGVVGKADSVSCCYVTGNVTATDNFVGGVVGYADGNVSCCYATGNVTTAGDYVGGVVGSGGSVSNCAALGREVSGTDDIGRIASSGKVSDSYAWNGMTVKGSGGEAGANLTYDGTRDPASKLDPQFEDIFGTDNTAWTYTTDALPTLANVGGTQSAKLPDWITSTTDADKTVYIDSAEELAALASAVNAGTTAEERGSGKTYILTRDIDLSAYSNWTLIGANSSNSFAGVFDGDGHIIEGLRIDAGGKCQGLFGYVNGTNSSKAQVKNIIVKNASVSGDNCVGAVVGCYGHSDSSLNYTDALTGCAMLGGNVNGAESVGGVAGEANSSVTGCYATGNVSATGTYVGGVVGKANNSVSNCYATGNVNGTGSEVGGVVGNASDNVTNCYATGNVTGDSYIGGVAGSVGGSATNCVALGRAVSGNSNVARVAGSGTVSGSFAWDGMKVNNTVTDQSAKGENHKNGADMQYSATFLPGNKLLPQFSSKYLTNNAAWTFANDKLPILKDVGGAQSDALPGWMTDTVDENTFVIYDAEDLKRLADEVNSGTTAEERGCGKTYILANDISLAAYAPGTPLGGTTGWTPIGKDSYHIFAGVFDGQGCEITGLVINGPDTDFRGLFGRTQGEDETHKAQVKNVTVVDASIVGKYYVGAVVGYYGGNSEPLTGCAAVGGSVKGQYVGGVTGTAYSDVTDCYSTADVTGTGNNVGGVVGYCDRKITNCHATGTVTGTGTDYTGFGGVAGIVHYAENCYATGNVISTGIFVGGVVGRAYQDVKNCHATGNVTGEGDVGGVVGATSSVESCYATGKATATGTEYSAGGVVGSAKSVKNCVALGSAVAGASDVHRVTGHLASGGTVSGAYAWVDMKVNGDPITDSTKKGLTHKNGADISSSNGLLYTATGLFGWDDFDTDVWELPNTTPNKLPKLIGTTDDPTMNLAMGDVDGTSYTITFDKQGGTGGTDNVNATLGKAMYSPIVKPTRANYVFAGYFDGLTDGIKYYNADGTSAHVWDKAAAVTLYALWTQSDAPIPSGGGGDDYAPLSSVTVYNDPSIPDATIWLTGYGLTEGDLLITETLTSGGDYNDMLALADAEDVFRVYNIYLRSGRESTGSAMYLHFDLAAKYAGEAFTLAHKKANGTVEYLYATASVNGDLEFAPLLELSPFMLVEGTLTQAQVYSAVEPPQTGDSSTDGLWIGIGMLALLTIGAAYGVKRRKRA